MESSNVEDPNAEEKVMQQISNSVPPEELPQVGKEPQEEENYCDDDDMEIEKELNSEKIPLNDELQHGYRILCELMSDSHKAVNWPFLNAVDDSIPELDDYYEQITRPMWMKKMRISFEKREYLTIKEFVADFRLMLENCYRYNGPDSYISKRGQRLETMLGQKLALLPRNLREKTVITPTEISSTPEELAFAAGLRRRTRAAGPPDSSALLNQLRQEEVIKEKKARKQHMEERRAAQEAHVQEIIGWEDILLVDPLNSQMKAMWELPQIGHFLFLCQEPLYLAEVPQYELERCFLMTRESTTMQRIMSSLLSTPHQRTKLYNHRHRMPYRVWEEKLQTKVKFWYDVLESFEGDINKTADKLGLDPFAFDVMGKKNPLLGKKYHELGFYRKVWIMKSVCDHVLELQDSLREAIELQPPEEQREYTLGTDAEGNIYIHFPQFCGADLRVYRHKAFPDPFLKSEDEDFEVESPVKPKMETVENFSLLKKKHSTKSQVTPEIISPPPSVRPSRLRQKIKTILPPTITTSGEDDDDDDEEEEEEEYEGKKRGRRRRRKKKKNNDNDYIVPSLPILKKRGRKKKYVSQSNVFNSWITSAQRRYKKNGSFRLPTYLTQNKCLKYSKNKDHLKKYNKYSANKKTLAYNKCTDHYANNKPNLPACKLHPRLKEFELKSDPEMPCNDDQNDDLCNGIKQEVSSESSDCNEGKNGVDCTCVESKVGIDMKTESLSIDAEQSSESVETKHDILKKEKKISPFETAIHERKRKPYSGKRKKKGFKTKSSSYRLDPISIKENESQENSLTSCSNDAVTCKTETEETDVELEPENGEFELIVDSVQELRDLVTRFDPATNSKGRKTKTKQPPRKKCVIDLHARLTYLLKELEPWEPKLVQANQKARRKMKREQESYKEETPRKELRTRNNQSCQTGERSSKNADSGQKSDQGRVKRNVRSPSKYRFGCSPSKSTLTPVKSGTSCDDESPDVSSRGRLRKRRIIPNNIENELNVKKRRSPKAEEKVNSSKSKRNSDLKSVEKVACKGSSSANNNQQSTSTTNISLISSGFVDGKSVNLKQSSYPVIHQLLSHGQAAHDTAAAQTEIKLISSKGILHSQNAFTNQPVMKPSKTTNVATTIHLSPQLLTPQAVPSNYSGQVGTKGKIQYYTQLSNLTPQLVQQLLRNATVTKSTSENDPGNKGRRTFVLSSAAIGHPSNLTDTEDKSKKSTILISSTPIPHSSATFTTSSTVIASAGTNTGNKPALQNANMHPPLLPSQFQVLLHTSDPSTLVAAAAASPKVCQNQTKCSTKVQQGPVYVISKPGVASHILGAGSKLTTSLPVQSSQAVQHNAGAIISSISSSSLMNTTVPSSVSFLHDNKPTTSLIPTVEPVMQNPSVDSQLFKNNLPKSPGKYACNVTVKSLLESRVIKRTVDDSSENVQVTNGLNLPNSQPVSVSNTSSIINNAVIGLNTTLSSSVNDSAHVAKNTCLLNTVQSQFLDVNTDQYIKMPSSIMLPSVQPCKSITQTIQSSKTPITVTPPPPHLISTVEGSKSNYLLTPNQANVLQSGSNLRLNIPQSTLLTQPALMSLKQSTGRSVAFLQSGTSLNNSKNVILKVVPPNLVTSTALGNEPSSNIVINVPKSMGQFNNPPTRKIMQNELMQLGNLPQHILTTVNPSGSKTQTTTVQSVLSSKSLSTPTVGLQIASSAIPLALQKSGNQSILLLSPKDQNVQQPQQQNPIGVIPVQDQYNSKDLLKKVSTVQQMQGLTGPTLQIIPSQANNTGSGLNNITTIQGQLLQSKNGNIILTHSAPSVPNAGNITQLLHSSLNNHLTVTNIKPDSQCSSVNNASSALIQTANVTSNIAVKGKEQLKTFKTILSNTGASIKLKNEHASPFQSSLRIDNNNFSDVFPSDTSSCNNLITTGLSNPNHPMPASIMSVASPLVQPKLISSVISSQISTNTTQSMTPYSAFTASNKARTVSIPQPVSALLSKSGETYVPMTTISSTITIPPAQTTQLPQNVSFISSSSSHQSSSIIPQHLVSSNSISAKDTDGILTLKSTSSLPVSVVPSSTTTDMSKIITKLSPQNIQTNLSQIKVLGPAVQSSIKNKHSLLQQKLSPPPAPPPSNVQPTQLQTLVPQKQAIVCQPQTTIFSNNLLNIGQTNTSHVSVPQLVLYNIGGQLVTPQGIPVTLENGVLKILTSPVATQNQVMFVQSPANPLVGSSQIQPISTPCSDLLKNIKPPPSAAAGTILLSDSSFSTTSAQSTVDVPNQMTYAVPAQGILPSGTEFHPQYSSKVITNLDNRVLASSAQEPVLENTLSMAQTLNVAATNVHNKSFLFTSPSTMVNKDIGTTKQFINSSNLSDIYLKKNQSISTKPGTTMVFMDANNLQTKHSKFYPVNMSDNQAISKPLGENVAHTHTVDEYQMCTPGLKTREKEDSFESASILLSLARQPTMSSNNVDIDPPVVSYGELESVNHHTQPD